MYYIPWNNRWEPTSVNQRLLDRGLPSRVEGRDVVIEFERPKPSWKHPFRRVNAAFHRPARLRLVYHSDQIINRIGLCSRGVVHFELVIEPLEAVMRESGYLAVGDAISERVITTQCCTPGPKLLRYLQTLEELDYARACGDAPSNNDYLAERCRLLNKIEGMIFDSDDFGDSDLRCDEQIKI